MSNTHILIIKKEELLKVTDFLNYLFGIILGQKCCLTIISFNLIKSKSIKIFLN